MRLTYGQQLVQFARSADTLTKGQFDDFFDLVKLYTRRTLNMSVTHVLLGSRKKQALFMLEELSKDSPAIITLKDPSNDKRCNGHAAYAYLHNRPLWILAKERGGVIPIGCGAGDKQLVDKWPRSDHRQNSEPLPGYRRPDTDAVIDPIRTSVLVPLRNANNRCFGVLSLETPDRIEITDHARSELQLIADAISICYRLWKFNQSQGERTRSALQHLKDEINNALPKLTKPKLFLASPSKEKRDEAVISLICKVIDEGEFDDGYERKVAFRDCFDLEFWEDSHESGNISDYLKEKLSSCKFAICYLSELSGSSSPRYQYNLNVVFEAGMLHLRTSELSEQAVAWIPIREKDSTEVPFDFSHERAIIVPRKGESLKKRTFEDMLCNRLATLLKADIRKNVISR